MKQKLIFLDIDGTLLPPGEMIVPESAVDSIAPAPTATRSSSAPGGTCG